MSEFYNPCMVHSDQPAPTVSMDMSGSYKYDMRNCVFRLRGSHSIAASRVFPVPRAPCIGVGPLTATSCCRLLPDAAGAWGSAGGNCWLAAVRMALALR